MKSGRCRVSFFSQSELHFFEIPASFFRRELELPPDFRGFMNQGVESRDGSRETNLFKITFQEHNPHVGPNQNPVFRSKVDQKLQRRFNLFLLMYVRQLIATLRFFVPAVSPGSLQRRLRSAVVRSASGGFGFCVFGALHSVIQVSCVARKTFFFSSASYETEIILQTDENKQSVIYKKATEERSCGTLSKQRSFSAGT